MCWTAGERVLAVYKAGVSLPCSDSTVTLTQLVFQHTHTHMSLNQRRLDIAAQNGNVAKLEALVQLPGVNVHANHDALFHNACAFGQTRVARWILEWCESQDCTTRVDIHANGEAAFTTACRNGQIPTALFLIEWCKARGGVLDEYPIDVHTWQERPFRTLCAAGCLRPARWLWAWCLARSSPFDVRAALYFLPGVVSQPMSVSMWLVHHCGVSHRYYMAFRWLLPKRVAAGATAAVALVSPFRLVRMLVIAVPRLRRASRRLFVS